MELWGGGEEGVGELRLIASDMGKFSLYIVVNVCMCA